MRACWPFSLHGSRRNGDPAPIGTRYVPNACRRMSKKKRENFPSIRPRRSCGTSAQVWVSRPLSWHWPKNRQGHSAVMTVTLQSPKNASNHGVCGPVAQR
jgi:hypothetical protein